MPKRELSVAIPAPLNNQLTGHLVRADGQEDLAFALWVPSQGNRRFSALINEVVLPEPGDHQVHGNVSFNPQYFERVVRCAAAKGMGVAFLHSHPWPGWQRMSRDDVAAERRMSDATEVLTGQPLLGLTVGSDGTWSARFWESSTPEGAADKISWCNSVRSVGKTLRASFNDQLLAVPRFQKSMERTVTVWGPANHAQLARLRIGIVGLGSVGSLVAEILARMGCTRVVLIDFDEVQAHNLDRLSGATKADVGRLKVDIASRQFSLAATAAEIDVECVPYSVAEEKGYRAALDCDVLFSCVDRPRARSILNHLAYAHLIPVIDGGIQVRFKNGEFSGADWQLQTAAPTRPCLDCLGVFNPADVATEKAGLLDDPSYLQGLEKNHRFKSNENVFPFSANLASLEIFQLIALATAAAGMDDFGVQRFRYMPGHLESDTTLACRSDCLSGQLTARGDMDFTLFGCDVTADEARRRQAQVATPEPNKFMSGVRSWFSRRRQPRRLSQ